MKLIKKIIFLWLRMDIEQAVKSAVTDTHSVGSETTEKIAYRVGEILTEGYEEAYSDLEETHDRPTLG